MGHVNVRRSAVYILLRRLPGGGKTSAAPNLEFSSRLPGIAHWFEITGEIFTYVARVGMDRRYLKARWASHN